MLHATNETTHTIQSFCTENWGWSETQVACRTMGYDYGIFLPKAGEQHFIEMSNPYFGNVECSGHESSIWECNMETDIGMNGGECSSVNNVVFLYCLRFKPATHKVPIRVFKTYDSYNVFVPMVFPGAMNEDMMAMDPI